MMSSKMKDWDKSDSDVDDAKEELASAESSEETGDSE